VLRSLIVSFSSVFLLCPAAQAEEPFLSKLEVPVAPVLETVSGGLVTSNVNYSDLIFNRQEHVTDKALVQLQEREKGTLQEGKVYLGGRFAWMQIYEGTNTAGRFPILSRQPPQHPREKWANMDMISDGSTNATLVLPWVTAFVQNEYSEIEYSGQEQFQWRKWFITIGDLKQSPYYLTVGKNTVEFGDFTSFTPVTHTHNAHYFWAQTQDFPQVAVGYARDGLHASATLLPGGRGLRVLDTPRREHSYDNFALNISKRFELDEDMSLKVGGGFLRSTIYNSTLSHHPPNTAGVNPSRYNPAMDLNLMFTYRNWDIAAEFNRTLREWPSTNWPVSAMSLQTRLRDSLLGRPFTYSLMYSRGEHGRNGTEWEAMQQIVGGLEWSVTPNVDLFAEYIHSDGFVPLIRIQQLANKSVSSDAVFLGGKFTF